VVGEDLLDHRVDRPAALAGRVKELDQVYLRVGCPEVRCVETKEHVGRRNLGQQADGGEPSGERRKSAQQAATTEEERRHESGPGLDKVFIGNHGVATGSSAMFS
jgi:hypothetical protein